MYVLPSAFIPGFLRLTSLQSPAYTEFKYSDLRISSQARSGPASGGIAPGGQRDLWREVAKVTAKITNTGKIAGAEAAQLYITLPETTDTPRQLRGFDKILLNPDASGTVEFSLLRRDLSVWDAENQVWAIPKGKIVVNVGASSRDLRLEGVIDIA
jgi:beta-glucosidase